MAWVRHDYNAKNTKWLLGYLMVLLFTALVFLQYTAAAVLSFIAVVAGLQWLYLAKVGTGLQFKNEKKRKRVLNGGESEWELVFENKGLPIWGGTLRIWFQDVVEPKGQDLKNHSELIELDIPFNVGFKQVISLKIPLDGKRRGLSRIRKMELQVPLPFGEGNIVLEYRDSILQEQLVYPKLREYSFHYAPSRQKPGQFNLKNSLFDDPFQPIGTRDYTATDQFNQIHWKASARLQKYQTKIHNQVANESMMFLLNVAERYATISNLEERIEELASYVENCYKEGVPYSIAVNIRSAGRTPYLYLPTGEGQKQRAQALELLSILSKNNSTMPFMAMLAHLDLHTELPFTTYVMTGQYSDLQRFIPIWSKKTELKLLVQDGSGIA